MSAPTSMAKALAKLAARQPLTASEVGLLLGYNAKTVTRWDRDGRLPAMRAYPGGHRRWDAAAIARIMTSTADELDETLP